MKWEYDGETLFFTYTDDGKPFTVWYDGELFYYVTNLQGDVVALLDGIGTEVVSYSYDAWGKLLSCTGTMADTVGFFNPLRYRGYVYDTETGLYYLQSRYYNPELGRFINADDISFLSASGTLLANNLFAYCENNPTTNCDSFGYAKINIKWVWWTVDSIIWLIPALFSIAKMWRTVSRSANKLYNFGLKMISYGKKLLLKLDDRLYCAFARESTYRILKTIGVLAGFVTVLVSIGAMVQYIIDILDGKWDGSLNTSNIRPKLDLTKDY